MKREDRLIREMATELYEHLQKEGALEVSESYPHIIRILRKSIRKAYKTGQESMQVPEQPKQTAFLETADPVRKEFIQFLRKQKILKHFLRNYEEYNKKPFNINDYLGDRGEEWADSAMYACFRWSGTPEGVSFWCEIASKWQSHLDTYNPR